ncbi:hypothetical protein BJ508DRAFT_31633 [Ascobolus immersus RN42]|uniref:RING-type domain-containing protein n=1 Tax=Ascobolus immersus RN42 TaxID=1160509 RepID=A0A3N4ISF9_ASCIM|nr:hypothetical protein BJ508DRAFT_31633 [Ascobolus immersus RN42]
MNSASPAEFPYRGNQKGKRRADAPPLCALCNKDEESIKDSVITFEIENHGDVAEEDDVVFVTNLSSDARFNFKTRLHFITRPSVTKEDRGAEAFGDTIGALEISDFPAIFPEGAGSQCSHEAVVIKKEIVRMQGSKTNGPDWDRLAMAILDIIRLRGSDQKGLQWVTEKLGGESVQLCRMGEEEQACGLCILKILQKEAVKEIYMELWKSFEELMSVGTGQETEVSELEAESQRFLEQSAQSDENGSTHVDGSVKDWDGLCEACSRLMFDFDAYQFLTCGHTVCSLCVRETLGGEKSKNPVEGDLYLLSMTSEVIECSVMTCSTKNRYPLRIKTERLSTAAEPFSRYRLDVQKVQEFNDARIRRLELLVRKEDSNPTSSLLEARSDVLLVCSLEEATEEAVNVANLAESSDKLRLNGKILQKSGDLHRRFEQYIIAEDESRIQSLLKEEAEIANGSALPATNVELPATSKHPAGVHARGSGSQDWQAEIDHLQKEREKEEKKVREQYEKNVEFQMKAIVGPDLESYRDRASFLEEQIKKLGDVVKGSTLEGAGGSKGQTKELKTRSNLALTKATAELKEVKEYSRNAESARRIELEIKWGKDRDTRLKTIAEYYDPKLRLARLAAAEAGFVIKP